MPSPRPLLASWLALLALSLALLGAATANPLPDNAKGQPSKGGNKPTPACSALTPPPIKGVKYLDVILTERRGVPASAAGVDPATTTPKNIASTIDICQVNITLTHPKAKQNDNVIVSVWLPLDKASWNGRFQATGGGGFRAGTLDPALFPAVAQGYSAVSTDAGVGLSNTGSFILNNATRKINEDLLLNFASRSLHEMTVIGKAMTEQFYGRKPISYWNGCSTGGRQGFMEAQKYPEDFDGIMAGSPAFNWARFVPSGTYAPSLRRRLGVKNCELQAIQKAKVAACDSLDGLTDGVIANFDKCRFDPSSMVGKTTACNETGTDVSITQGAAQVANAIWDGFVVDGKKIWHGYGPDTDLLQASGVPDRYAAYSKAWVQLALERDPNFDIDTLSPPELAKLVAQSYREYNDLIGADDPNLSKFKKRGGKLISWHGTIDQAFGYYGSVDYHQRVVERMGGEESVSSFYRFFTAPGVAHCRGGTGPAPDDPLAALVEWVEKGKAPEYLDATRQDAGKRKEQLCRWPKMPSYKEDGSVVCKVDEFSRKFRPLPTKVPKVW